MLVLEGFAYAHRGHGQAYAFDMEAQPGEVTAITGASGAGKSTLLDLIAGFLQPAAGRISLDGLDLSPLPPERRPVSILFQSETLFEHLSAAANVALGLPAGTERRRTEVRVAEALAEVGLPEVGRQRAATLSGGQKQRVALARTLLRDRPVLLLDEPFSALDEDTRASVRQLVGKLTAQRQWHTVLVSHNPEDSTVLARRSYRLAQGRLWLG